MEDITSIPAKKPARKSTVPKSDIDLSVVATKVVAKWAENDWLKIQWITQAEFEAAVTHYTAELSQRMQSGSSRPAITASLRKLETQLDKGVKYVKHYLFEKYDDDAKDHYHAFGLVKIGKAIMLPRDQNQKVEALALTLKAIIAEDFNDKPYGKTFWLEKSAAYNALLSEASAIDGDVASLVGNKNQHRNSLTRVLNSVILALRANYPDNYAAEIRSWGFQKEKY